MARGRQITKKISINDLTITEAAELFYQNNKVRGLAEETQKGYKGYIRAFINWLEKDVYLSEITTTTIDEYILFKYQKGVKSASIKSVITHLKRFFKFCAKRGYMEPIEIENIKVETELKEPYTAEEMRVLLQKPKTDKFVEYRNWVMINYFFGTGQRLSTVINIRVKDLDLQLATVKLVWNKDKIQKRMPLSKSLVRILENYIDLWGLEEEDYLFPEYEGGQLK